MSALVNQTRNGGLIEGENHPLHFAPTAEVDDVAKLAAAPGAAASFRDRSVTEMGKKIRGFGKSAPAGGMNVVTQE